MVENGHVPDVVQMRYTPADSRLTHVDVIGFDDLRRLNEGTTQRCEFLVLAFVLAGTGSVAVDFELHKLSTGSVVWVSPGSVHRWVEFAELSGSIVMCPPTSPLTAGTRALAVTPRTQAVFTPDTEQARYVRAALDHLVLEVRPDLVGSSPELHAALLTALLARVPAAPVGGRADGEFERFRACVETDFRAHRDVRHYARKLGYVERTLTRRSVAATGGTAKAFIEQRVVLEAKRLLAHHQLSSAACATELGFVDPSAFSLFFRRVAGVRPGAWQAAHAHD